MSTSQDVQQIVQSIIGGTAVLLLAGIGKMLLGVRKDVRRFMQEHTWLLATSLWTRDKVMQIMVKLEMPITDDPPDKLPWHGEDNGPRSRN